jgi:signal transduction histidine kinase
VRYTGLDPGAYRFRVKGSNHDGVWNEEGLELTILIAPPFWGTWWFRSIVVMLLVSLGAAAFRMRVTRLLDMERMRLRIASDLHDDIGSNLGSIALMADLARKRLVASSREDHQLKQISSVARSTAESLREIVWIINPEHERFENLALKLREIAQRILAGFSVRFQIDQEESTVALPMEFRRQVVLAYKEMLTNVVRHSGATDVTIALRWEGESLCIQVGDNGRGFEPDLQHSGSGLSSLQRRAESLRGRFRIKTGRDSGTTVTFWARIP